jgi:nucleotide-binding universal stress UspA family protein
MDAPHRFRIVAAIDRTEYAEIVLEHAIDQAARHDAPDLEFVTIVPPGDNLEAARDELATHVIEALELLGQSDADWRARVHVLAGDAADEITSFAADLDADLIVAGRFGAHDKHRTFATDIVAHAACPVLVVGLAEHVVEKVAQCPDCVAVRHETNGEAWFCSKHASDPPLRLTAMLPAFPWTQGGPLL